VLPDCSGIDLIRELRERRPELPVVLITGYASREQEELAMQAGAFIFAPKPFEEAELLQAVHDALASGPAATKERLP
jgi:DNA-binding NtrC family response regulator